ncbi:MAG TPA: hypothetical protein VET89_02895 [Stellaceae bacterium]|nr:hypothetical protein [Stellaceae bacterium]
MTGRRHFAAIGAAVALGCLLAGCSLTHRIGASINPDSLGLTDRCANMMQAAMPFADIEIGSRSSRNVDLNTTVARVSGTRTDLAKNPPVSPEVAAECEFRDNILSAFHWTKGGPVH